MSGRPKRKAAAAAAATASATAPARSNKKRGKAAAKSDSKSDSKAGAAAAAAAEKETESTATAAGTAAAAGDSLAFLPQMRADVEELKRRWTTAPVQIRMRRVTAPPKTGAATAAAAAAASDVKCGFHPGASEAELCAAEAKLGAAVKPPKPDFKLPLQLRELYKLFGGTYGYVRDGSLPQALNRAVHELTWSTVDPNQPKDSDDEDEPKGGSDGEGHTDDSDDEHPNCGASAILKSAARFILSENSDEIVDPDKPEPLTKWSGGLERAPVAAAGWLLPLGSWSGDYSDSVVLISLVTNEVYACTEGQRHPLGSISEWLRREVLYRPVIHNLRDGFTSTYDEKTSGGLSRDEWTRARLYAAGAADPKGAKAERSILASASEERLRAIAAGGDFTDELPPPDEPEPAEDGES